MIIEIAFTWDSIIGLGMIWVPTIRGVKINFMFGYLNIIVDVCRRN